MSHLTFRSKILHSFRLLDRPNKLCLFYHLTTMNTYAIFKVILTVVALVASEESASSSPKTKVNIDVYFEALCPDSLKFFNEQLTPNLYLVDKYVELNLVPFGRAKHEQQADGSWKSTCRHTNTECVGHKVMACALLESLETPVLHKFISCLMRKGDKTKPYPGLECAKEQPNVLNYAAIESCTNTPAVEDKLEELRLETNSLSPPLPNVPTIVFNKEYKANDQTLALTKFKTVLCEYIEAQFGDVDECAHGGHNNAAETTLTSTLLLSSVTAAVMRFL